jgi:hypothetical protein
LELKELVKCIYMIIVCTCRKCWNSFLFSKYQKLWKFLVLYLHTQQWIAVAYCLVSFCWMHTRMRRLQ